MAAKTPKRRKMKSSGRKALQPRNIFPIPPTPRAAADTQFLKKKPKAPPHDDTKENLLHVPVVESMDASLAEELSAFKKKLGRLRDDWERTEKLLEERDGAMDLKMNHLLQRGEIQKSLEIQVDRLFRLKELHAYSSKISPVRSLRAKEQEKTKRVMPLPPIISKEPTLCFDPELSDEPEEESREIASG